MNLERFLAERTDEWSELDGLVRHAGGQASNLTPTELRRLGHLYRSATADLSIARSSFPQALGTIRLQGLVASAHSLVYSKAQREGTAKDFFSHIMWQRIRQNSRCIAIAAAVLIGFTALGALWALVEPSAATGIIPGGFQITSHPGVGKIYGESVAARGGVSVTIFVNNILVSIMAIAGGFTFGILTTFSLAFNGAMIGAYGALYWKAGGFEAFTRFVVPHGILELSMITLAGAAGFAIARAMIDPGRLSRSDAIGRLTPLLGSTLLSVMMFLVVAGTTEGIVTPWGLPLWAALTVGFGYAGIFWFMVIWRGAKSPTPDLLRYPNVSKTPTAGALIGSR